MKPMLIIIIATFNVVMITLSIILAKTLESAKWWYWVTFLTPFITIMVILCIVVLKALTKKKPDVKIKPMEIKQAIPLTDKEKADAKTFALKIFKEDYAEELINTNEQIMYVGQEGTDRTKIYMLSGDSYHTKLFWALILKMQNGEHNVISGESYKELVSSGRLYDAINQLAENPEVKAVHEENIMIDDYGRPIKNVKTTFMTKKQIEAQEKEKAKEDKESF